LFGRPLNTQIVSTEGTLGGEPRIDGRRIAVPHVASRVIDKGEHSQDVAADYDLDLAAVHHARAYYYDHPDEMQEWRKKETSSRPARQRTPTRSREIPPARMRVPTDEHVSPVIANTLQSEGLDAVTIYDTPVVGKDDPAVLEFANENEAMILIGIVVAVEHHITGTEITLVSHRSHLALAGRSPLVGR
jgi:uncharacterized protein (DUF433 family)